MKIGINGFGRIGRQVFRMAYERARVEIVHVNDVTEAEALASLLQFDTTYGRWSHRVRGDGNNLHVDGTTVSVSAEKDPARLPWREKGVDVVLESTGVFRRKEDAEKHRAAGAKKVLLSAPGRGELDGDFVIGRDTHVIGGHFVKVLAWYDNECAFSRRCVDTMTRML